MPTISVGTQHILASPACDTLWSRLRSRVGLTETPVLFPCPGNMSQSDLCLRSLFLQDVRTSLSSCSNLVRCFPEHGVDVDLRGMEVQASFSGMLLPGTPDLGELIDQTQRSN